ncbi:MarR family winged helix-turn-helix transcriptional regulator [Caldimonas tepidiphila]|uniref:MarR family winged helix-turn-helix transcriptional regulator n=1 Tax=Caldimonas tepidiphila TaxID=2315841 RepID=UPI000E5C41BD|nr:MarR family transcriptional regulator [Caldimonas tepidiphila]
MELQTFLPYRLAVLASAVSQSISAVYADRFALSRDEWRILATLAENPEMKTTEAAAHTTLDKMQVSRAVASLEARGLLEREPDESDRRNRILKLLPAGRALFRRIEPMAEAREAFLLEALDDEERAVLDRALDKLLARARQLERQG